MTNRNEANAAADLLRRARLLLSEPGRWTQGTMARDENDEPVSVMDDRACQWCIGGALLRVSPITGWLANHLLACDIIRQVCKKSPATFNDACGRTYEEIIAVLVKAEKLVREE